MAVNTFHGVCEHAVSWKWLRRDRSIRALPRDHCPTRTVGLHLSARHHRNLWQSFEMSGLIAMPSLIGDWWRRLRWQTCRSLPRWADARLLPWLLGAFPK